MSCKYLLNKTSRKDFTPPLELSKLVFSPNPDSVVKGINRICMIGVSSSHSRIQPLAGAGGASSTYSTLTSSHVLILCKSLLLLFKYHVHGIFSSLFTFFCRRKRSSRSPIFSLVEPTMQISVLPVYILV